MVSFSVADLCERISNDAKSFGVLGLVRALSFRDQGLKNDINI